MNCSVSRKFLCTGIEIFTNMWVADEFSKLHVHYLLKSLTVVEFGSRRTRFGANFEK